jgi:hypothetical protein
VKAPSRTIRSPSGLSIVWITQGAATGADPIERELVRQTCGEAHGEVERLKRRVEQELCNAGSDDALGHPATP